MEWDDNIEHGNLPVKKDISWLFSPKILFRQTAMKKYKETTNKIQL